MDIPLAYLVSGDQPTIIGLMTINNMTEDDWQQKWGENILAAGGKKDRVGAYARVVASGDVENSRKYANNVVTDMLIFLRAIGFPITIKSQNQFGLLNEYAESLIPYRIGPPTENYRVEFPVHLSSTVSTLHTYEVRKDILNQISLQTLERLQRLIDEDYLKPSTELKRKFFLALRWLGEATNPDTIEARFLKLNLSLEALIGGGITDSRKTKKTLALRCAVITGKNLKEQHSIYNAILKYYDKRSRIVHGENEPIIEKDFSAFGRIVRKTAWSVLEAVDKFEKISDLNSWVNNQPFEI